MATVPFGTIYMQNCTWILVADTSDHPRLHVAFLFNECHPGRLA